MLVGITQITLYGLSSLVQVWRICEVVKDISNFGNKIYYYTHALNVFAWTVNKINICSCPCHYGKVNPSLSWQDGQGGIIKKESHTPLYYY